MNEDDIQALAAKLPQQVKPQRDLWPDIEQAIQTPQRSRWNTVWAQAAAVVLLVAGSSGLTYLTMQDGTPVETTAQPVVQTAVDVERLFQPVSGEFGVGYSLGADYIEAHRALERSVLTKLDTLPPETAGDVIKNLNTIRSAINDINEALAQEPDNALLQELLLNTYHEEMSLMRKVNGLGNSSMRRDDI